MFVQKRGERRKIKTSLRLCGCPTITRGATTSHRNRIKWFWSCVLFLAFFVVAVCLIFLIFQISKEASRIRFLITFDGFPLFSADTQAFHILGTSGRSPKVGRFQVHGSMTTASAFAVNFLTSLPYWLNKQKIRVVWHFLCPIVTTTRRVALKYLGSYLNCIIVSTLSVPLISLMTEGFDS